MANLIYSLCATTSGLCAFLLMQSYFRSRYRLLLWGGLCFIGLTINNILLVMDKIYFPMIDFGMWRLIAALSALMIMLYGLIWDTE